MHTDVFSSVPSQDPVGLYGTLYDQILATVALIIGLGSPTSNQITAVLLFVPPVLAGLTVFPVYFTTKKLTESRLGGFASSVVLALLPGLFFYRSLIGVSDYHAAVPLFITTSVYLIVSSLKSLSSMEFGLKHGFNSSEFKLCVLAGVSSAVATLVWPPSVLLVGIFFVFVVIETNTRSIIERNQTQLNKLSIVYSASAALPLTLAIETYSFAITQFSFFHICFPLVVFAYAFISETVSRLDISQSKAQLAFTPIFLFGVLVIGILTDPSFISSIIDGLQTVFGLWLFSSPTGMSPLGGTWLSALSGLYTYFGAMSIVSLLGAVFLGVFSVTKNRPDFAYMSVGFISFLCLGITNISFAFYLSPFVAIVSGFSIYRLLVYTEMFETSGKLTVTQYVSIGLILALFIPVLVAPIGGTVFASGSTHSPGSADTWVNTTEWINSETPESQDIYTQEYNKSGYSVLTWKNSGTWVLSNGERPVVTSSISSNSSRASRLLLSTNKSNFKRYESSNIRYITVSDDFISIEKSFNGIVKENPNRNVSDYYFPVYNSSSGALEGTIKHQQYYETLAYRMYAANSGEIRSQPVVVNWEVRQTDRGAAAVTSAGETIRQFETFSDANRYLKSDSTSQIGGVSGIPQSTVPALQKFRLVHASNVTTRYNSDMPEVKVFEKVSGAKLEGTGPENTTVLAKVRLSTENGYTFVYSQTASTDSSGEFEMIVPYSTYGKENTEAPSEVEAETPYVFRAISQDGNSTTKYQSKINVSDTAVVKNQTDPISVELVEHNTTESKISKSIYTTTHISTNHNANPKESKAYSGSNHGRNRNTFVSLHPLL
jgi:dolichyl-diphosphooligosaccharide--protein glycosyltransferase